MQCCAFANKHLEKGINVFKFLKIVQFLQIQNVLESTGEEGQDDLVKLRDDLVELIHVSEGTFLSFIIIIIIIIKLHYITLHFTIHYQSNNAVYTEGT